MGDDAGNVALVRYELKSAWARLVGAAAVTVIGTLALGVGLLFGGVVLVWVGALLVFGPVAVLRCADAFLLPRGAGTLLFRAPDIDRDAAVLLREKGEDSYVERVRVRHRMGVGRYLSLRGPGWRARLSESVFASTFHFESACRDATRVFSGEPPRGLEGPRQLGDERYERQLDDELEALGD